ncbi:MAG: helix-turn-helix domain-containing protein [Candidatus Dormibacteraeota bacterium]|nr:helix-turn-helix domain-containing protein [Candidatus Dormibacteraeota bacterium]
MERTGLRRQRLLRGWSLDRAATELADLIEERTRSRPRAEGNAVGRWERGRTQPSPFYVTHLCELYQRTAEELDLVPEIMDDVKRRQFLGGMTALGGLMLVGQPVLADPERPRVEELEQITDQFGSWYWRLSPSALLPLVREHQYRLLATVGGAVGTSARSLGALAARTTVIYGLATYRRGDFPSARERFLAAARLGQLAGDRSSEAMALIAHRAVLGGPAPLDHGDHEAAHQLLTLAETRAGRSAPPLLRTWLHSSRAEEAAALGREADALLDIERAESALAKAGPQDLTGFFDHWDALRLEGWRASVLLALDRPADACRVLEPVVAGTPPELPGPRAAVLADLAAALAQTSEVERSCALLGESFTTAQAAGVHDGVSRVRHVRRVHLERWADSASVQRLDQVLAQ